MSKLISVLNHQKDSIIKGFHNRGLAPAVSFEARIDNRQKLWQLTIVSQEYA